MDGDLVREGDHAVLANARFNLTSWQEPLELRWPTGWTSRATDDGELELLDADGVARARTGMRVAIGAVADVGSPRVRDGVLEVCPSGPNPVHDVGP